MKKLLALIAFSVLLLVPVGMQNAFAQVPEFVLRCYSVTVENPVIDPPSVELVDEIGTETVDLLSGPTIVCEEALKHSDVAPNNPRHWVVYNINGQLDFDDREITDQFGTETISGFPSVAILVPATKNGQSPPNDLHWKWYEVIGTVDPPAIVVSDQFGSNTFDPVLPVFYATNTFKNNEGDLNGFNMKCYAKSTSTPPITPAPHTFADQFGTSLIPLGEDLFLCVMEQKESMAVGGEMIPLDTTSLLLTGAQMNATWMIPVIVSGIGIGIVIARKF